MKRAMFDPIALALHGALWIILYNYTLLDILIMTLPSSANCKKNVFRSEVIVEHVIFSLLIKFGIVTTIFRVTVFVWPPDLKLVIL